ncbi:hypothetical protein, partial [Nocardia sp. NPDC004722]
PLIVAGIGWAIIYLYADKANPGVYPIEWSIGWVVLGIAAFLMWSRIEKIWPFGPKQVREEYLLTETAPAA